MSDAKSLFLSLTSGLKFNNKKYDREIKRFEKGKTSRTGSLTGTEDDSKPSHFVPVQSLDFFGSSSSSHNDNTTATSSNMNEKEEQHVDEEREEEEDSSSDDDDENQQSSSSTGSKFASQKEIMQFRVKQRIYVKGNDPIPAPIQSFDELAPLVRNYLLRNIQSQYSSPTAVQMQTLPVHITNNKSQAARELLVSAPTGSGKTASFVIPILHHLRAPEKNGFRALVIAPTRVLAEQIYQVFHTFAKGKQWSIRLLTNETSLAKLREQMSSPKNDILVATPAKLITLIQEKAVSLANIQRLVFDEADRLFDMGFAEQIDEVIAACTNPNVVKCLFSATIPLGVEQLASTILRDPIRISIGVKNSGAETITQKLMFVGNDAGKLLALRERIHQGLKPPVLIFVQSIDRAKELYNELLFDNYNVEYIHGQRSDNQTRQIVNNFRLGKTWALICTDVMARGLDFKGISCVVNYDFPKSTVEYIHRIGRTGRAGQQGEAITYFTYDDISILRNIADVMRKSGCEVPEWMLNLKRVSSEEMQESAIKNAIFGEQKKAKKKKFRKPGYQVLNNKNTGGKRKRSEPQKSSKKQRK